MSRNWQSLMNKRSFFFFLHLFFFFSPLSLKWELCLAVAFRDRRPWGSGSKGFILFSPRTWGNQAVSFPLGASLLLIYKIRQWWFLRSLPTLESESRSVLFYSLRLWPHWLYSPRNSPGQNTGVSRLSPLQRIFPAQESNPDLPHCRRIFSPAESLGMLPIYGPTVIWCVLLKET